MTVSSSQRLVEEGSASVADLRAEVDARQIIKEEAVRGCAEHFGKDLRALVLTGSLARNEGSFLPSENGWRVLGDAEFIVILEDSSAIPDASEQQRVRTQIMQACSRRGVAGAISLSISHASFLCAMRPSIFAFELRHCGECLAGEQDILTLIPEFAASDIPLEDAWRMLCNRMIEQLGSIAETDIERHVISQELLYRTVKLYLDMATSLLLFLGAYEPTYRGRVERLRGLKRAVDIDFDMEHFTDRVATCTEWKLAPLEKANLGPEWEFLQASQRDATCLMKWQLSRLAGIRGNSQNLARALMKNEPLTTRLRGWAYVLRGSGWLRSYRNWPRWTKLALAGSPRKLIYAAAIEIYSSMPSPAKPQSEPDGNRVCDLVKKTLPVVNVAGESRDWRAAVQMCVWNYRQFLENTRS
jgi:hypothetical protein